MTADKSKLAPEVKELMEAQFAKEKIDEKRRREHVLGKLKQRCRGAKSLASADRETLLTALRTGAAVVGADGLTQLQQVNSLIEKFRSGDRRLNLADESALTNALYSNDPALRQLAFSALLLGIVLRAKYADALGRRLPAGQILVIR